MRVYTILTFQIHCIWNLSFVNFLCCTWRRKVQYNTTVLFFILKSNKVYWGFLSSWTWVEGALDRAQRDWRLENEINNVSNQSINQIYIMDPQYKLWTLGLGWTPLVSNTLCKLSHTRTAGEKLCPYIWIFPLADINLYPFSVINHKSWV